MPFNTPISLTHFRRLRIELVPVVTLSGPTSGRVLEEELWEWAVQVSVKNLIDKNSQS